MFCPNFNVFKFIDSGMRVTSRNYYVRVICIFTERVSWGGSFQVSSFNYIHGWSDGSAY